MPLLPAVYSGESHLKDAELGIYFLANDVVLDWLTASINSVRANGCDLPIVIIPFDERMDGVSRLAEQRGATIWNDDSFLELDALGKIHTSDKLGPRGFRKLAAFWGPFQRFLLVDADTAALLNYAELLERYQHMPTEFVYFDLVGRSNPQWEKFRPILEDEGGVSFNAGAFMSQRGKFSLEDFQSISRNLPRRQIRLPVNVMEQPFLNFAVATKKLSVCPAWEVVPDLKHHTWAGGGRDEIRNAFRTGRDQGQRFPFVHWAGYDVNPSIPLGEIYLHFRLWRAPLRERARVQYVWRVKPRLRRIKQKFFVRNKK